MLKQCTLIATLFWLIMLNFIFLNLKNVFIINILQGLFLSTLVYPMFCSILNYKTLLHFFKTNYFKCIKQGFLVYLLTYTFGLIFIIPFILCYKSISNNFKLTTAILGGFFTTIFLIFLSSLAFVPFWPTKKLKKAIRMSHQLSKNNKITIFKLILKTYLKFLLIIPTPWALKTYILNIKKLKVQITKKLKTTLKYTTQSKNKFKTPNIKNYSN